MDSDGDSDSGMVFYEIALLHKDYIIKETAQCYNVTLISHFRIAR